MPGRYAPGGPATTARAGALGLLTRRIAEVVAQGARRAALWLARTVRVDFTPSPRPTLGVEWEFALVDRTTRDLTSRAGEVLAALRNEDGEDHPRIHKELLRNTVEVVTGICESVPEAVEDLRASLRDVRRVTDPLGIDLLSAGTHPFARWSAQQVTENPRYAELINRTQWWGRQMLIWGVHVHVGVGSVHKVLPILNTLLNHYPHLQALSASSPFWTGTDTGYASNRALMFQQLPTAGLPFQFGSWPEFESYIGDLCATGVIDALSDVRWDIRPSPVLGTLETRVCDGVPTVRELGALAALVHCLVVDLDARLDAGEELPTMPPWHVQENKWRSARYGLEAEIILDAAGRERLVTDDLDDLLERLDPVARRLGCAGELAAVADIPRRGASYQRQRAVAAATGGDLVAVVDSLVAELREDPAP
ncbi:carboxylate-amine ligase [Kineococcus xinjiangensis]|uniref:Putative glutamate--cysteine ligase 2 n=1 Tax=Kineococcus xinjiangensis TaxID=512762 RepID=A0A2S6IUM7_9ACTN|nr:glutamate--cysteine ligase [Kineococcus xinjiangensis]PPK97889.1 carboxylate-amine ligase [Kineococcus xinjiangensis]